MLQFIVNGLCSGSTMALVALGFGLIYTTTGTFHIAHGSVYAVAAYAFYVGLAVWKLPLGVAILGCLFAAAACGIAMDRLVYQPLAKRQNPSAALLISSLGAQVVVTYLLAGAFGQEAKSVQLGAEKSLVLGTLVISHVQLAQLAAGAAVTLAFALFMKVTPWGQLCRAAADDSTLAEVLGVRVARVRAVAFGVGSALAAAGASLGTADVGTDPHVGYGVALSAIVACILGGVRNFLAPALGAVLLGLAQGFVTWQAEAKWTNAATFGLLLIFLFFRPQGLFPHDRRGDEQP